MFKSSLGHVLGSPVSFFDTTPMGQYYTSLRHFHALTILEGRILSRLSKDQDTVDAELSLTLTQVRCTVLLNPTVSLILVLVPSHVFFNDWHYRPCLLHLPLPWNHLRTDGSVVLLRPGVLQKNIRGDKASGFADAFGHVQHLFRSVSAISCAAVLISNQKRSLGFRLFEHIVNRYATERSHPSVYLMLYRIVVLGMQSAGSTWRIWRIT